MKYRATARYQCVNYCGITSGNDHITVQSALSQLPLNYDANNVALFVERQCDGNIISLAYVTTAAKYMQDIS
jgi:hypothetical protein